MNIAAFKSARRRKEEFDTLGLEEYRVQALQNLRLKTVIKESHCTPIHAVAFNHASPDLHNVFATVGRDQATVYDDDHMVDNVAVIVQLTNEPSEHAAGGELLTCCWLSSKGWCDQVEGDACLAVAGADHAISIISVVEARVIKLLKGHSKDVIELSAAPSTPGLLLSLSKDGNVRLWDVAAEEQLSSIQTDANCIAVKEDGSGFAIGTSRGRLVTFDIGSDKAGRAMILEGSRQELKLQGGSHTEAVDCIRYVPGNRLLSKSCDGRMFSWDLPSLAAIAAWKVPGCSQLGSSLSTRCQFGTTPDGTYVAVGNATGDCYVYDARDGKRHAHTSAIRVSAPVRSCGITSDCRHVVAAIGKGFIFRWEYLGKDGADEEQAEGDENDNGNAGGDKADGAGEEGEEVEEEGV